METNILFLVGILSFLSYLEASNSPPPHTCPPGPCTAGQFFDTKTGRCLSCILGTNYMDQSEQKCQRCKPCSNPKSFSGGVLLQACSLTTNAVIGCKDGFYLDTVSRACTPCTLCADNEVEKEQCDIYSDRICQTATTPVIDSKPVMAGGHRREVRAVNQSLPKPPLCDDGPCTLGQYYVPKTNQCLPCELNQTYMDQPHHQCVHCKLCTRPAPASHEFVHGQCTLSKDTVIACRDGYYFWKQFGYCEPCSPCGENEIQKKNCSLFSDTICEAVITLETTTMGNAKTNTTIGIGLMMRSNSTTGMPEEGDSSMAIAIGCGVGIPLLILLALIIGICLYRRYRSPQRPSQNDVETTKEESQPMN